MTYVGGRMEAVSCGGGRRRGERRRGELTGEARESEVSDARCSVLGHFISRMEADTAMGGGQVGGVA
jgi:hypothetical protein